MYDGDDTDVATTFSTIVRDDRLLLLLPLLQVKLHQGTLLNRLDLGVGRLVCLGRIEKDHLAATGAIGAGRFGRGGQQ